jgi:hypothetical protein
MLLVLCQAGCRPIMPDAKGQSPLKPAGLSQDSVVLDIFFIRFPFGEEKDNEKLWEEIDEQHFSPECRQRLIENGFRVGRIGGRIPVELSRLLELGDKPAEPGEPNQLAVEDIGKGPRVNRRHLQIKPCQRSEIMASEVYGELPIIVKDDSDQISGKFLKQAQGMLALCAELKSDGQVSLSITPEVHYGQPLKRWVSGAQGVLKLDSSRSREVFDSLAARATLAPGDMFVVSTLSNRPGSLGHYLFTETNSGKLEQKLLVIRLSQTQHDDLFGDYSARNSSASEPAL